MTPDELDGRELVERTAAAAAAAVGMRVAGMLDDTPGPELVAIVAQLGAQQAVDELHAPGPVLGLDELVEHARDLADDDGRGAAEYARHVVQAALDGRTSL